MRGKYRMNKMICMFLSVILLIGTLPFVRGAAVYSESEVSSEGVYFGENGSAGEGEELEEGISWTLDDNGLLTVFGSGEIENRQFASNPNIKSLIIEEGVTNIGYRAFYNCSNLKTAIFPASLGRMERPFEGTGLETVVFAEGTEQISSSVFLDCTKLTSVSLPESLQVINQSAFEGCTSLTNISLPQSLKRINDSAFKGCTSLKDVELPDGLTDIGYMAFAGCTSLTDIRIPPEVKNLDATFRNCSNMKSVYIAADLSGASNSPFGGCRSLETILFADNVHQVGTFLFSNCSGLKSITIPGTINTIGPMAFTGCSNLEEVRLEEGVNNISFRAFENCSKLKDLILPESLHGISSDICKGVTELTIHGYAGTLAESFAIENGYNFQVIQASGGTVTLNVIDEQGELLTKGYRIDWYSGGSVIASGRSLSGCQKGDYYYYRIVLDENLVKQYEEPPVQATGTIEKDTILTCQLVRLQQRMVQGTVYTEQGTPFSGASVQFTQKFSGGYTERIDCKTAADGTYNAELRTVETTVQIIAADYVPVSMNLTDLLNSGQNPVLLKNATLKPLTSNRIVVTLLEKSAALEGETGSLKTVTDFSDLEFRLYKKDGHEEICGITLQYPYLIFSEGAVSAGEELEIEIESLTGNFEFDTGTLIMDEQICGSYSTTGTEKGSFSLTATDACAIVFDEDGNYYNTWNLSGDFVSDPMPEGQYKMVLFRANDLLHRISTLDTFYSMNLKVEKDYLIRPLTIMNGTITSLGSIAVPNTDISQLSYLSEKGNYLNANKKNVAIGSLLTMKASYKIDERFEIDNESVVIQLPAALHLIEGSVTLDGHIFPYNYNDEKGILTVNTAGKEGILRWIVSPTEIGEWTTDACLQFIQGNTKTSELIGSCSISAQDLAVQMPDIIGVQTAPVMGTALADSIIRIFDGDNIVAETAANKRGSWSYEIALSGLEDCYMEHDIRVDMISEKYNFQVKSQIMHLVYDPSYSALSQIEMLNYKPEYQYFVTAGGSEGKVMIPVLQTSILDYIHPDNTTVSFTHSDLLPEYTFKVHFTENNPDHVTNVKVITTSSNGKESIIPCEYMDSYGCWVGKHKYNSKTKPDQITATYDSFSLTDQTLPVEELVTSEELDGMITRRYYSDSSKFMTAGMFGLGWRCDLEYRADFLKTEEGDYIVLSGPSGFTIFEKDNGVYRDGLTGENTALINGDEIQIRLDTGQVETFNHKGQLARYEETDGTALTFEYDGQLLTAVKGESGFEIDFSYKDGKVNQVSHNGKSAEYTYEGDYLVSAVSDEGTETYEYFSDRKNKGKGALSEVKKSDGTTLFLDYDSFGRLVSHTMNETLTTYAYADENTVTVSYPDGLSVTSHYEDGLLKSLERNGENVVEYTYDEKAQIQEAVFGDVRYGYSYDEQGNVSSVTEPDGSSVHYTYGENNQITSVADELGNTVSYKYNAIGDLTGIIYPDDSFEEYDYSSEGILESKRFRNGKSASMQYNEKGLLSKITWPDGETTEYGFDEKGEIISISENGEVTSLQYDENGNITAAIYPDGRMITYRYDSRNRVSSVTDSAGFTTNYFYDEKTGLVSRLSDGNGTVLTEYERDENGLVTRQKNANGTYTDYKYEQSVLCSIDNYQADGTRISYQKYIYDNQNNVIRKETDQGTWNYEYDPLSQLIRSTAPDGSVTEYAYDKAGNRTEVKCSGITESYSVDSVNQYTNVGTDAVVRDKNGALTEIGADSFTYDARGRLISSTIGEDTFTYTYDVFGNRNSVSKNGVTTEYVYSPLEGGSVMTAYQENKAISYFYGAGLTGQQSGGECLFYDFDMLGCTTEVTNSAGQIVNRYSYGDLGVNKREESVFSPFTYGGRFGVQDEQNQLYYINERYLHTSIGRFITPDPSGVAFDTNMYRYSGNNPVSRLDINGECAVHPGLITVGISVAIFTGIQFLDDAVSTFNQWYTTGDWDWTGTMGGYLGAGTKGLVVGGAIVLTGSAGLTGLYAIGSGAVSDGLKTGIKSWVDNHTINWTDVGISALIGGLFGVGQIKKPFTLTDWGPFNKGTWSFDSGYLRMITNMLKNHWNYKIGTIWKWSFKKYISQWITEGFWRYLKYRLRDLTLNIIGIIDPSGYVYEAVPSNRLDGVTATAYTIESWMDDHGEQQQETVIWKAEEYDQNNPLLTDKNGEYAWDVPNGQWMVTYTKDGYENTRSSWLPVPPPQTEINVGMISYQPPEVDTIRANRSGIILEFSKYMEPNSLIEAVSVSVDGTPLKGIVEPLNEEENPETGRVFASIYRFIPDEEVIKGKLATVTVSEKAVSYAGVPMSAPYKETKGVEEVIEEITTTEIPECSVGATVTTSIQLLPKNAGADRTVSVISLGESIVSVPNNTVKTDENGRAVFALKGELPGTGHVLIRDEVSGMFTIVDIEISMQEANDSEIRQAEADQTAAMNVVNLIRAIGTVSLDSEEAIKSARTAYDTLTDSQKALIAAAETEALKAAEQKYTELLNPDISDLSFKDVKDKDYFFLPVLWAVNHKPQITKGTSDSTFSPEATCTRAQVVTFLWRAMGEPKPSSTKNPFKDVASNAYYYKAVLWAVENNITSGTSKTAFSPDNPCTRGQVATFLWRTNKEPEASGSNPFTDVTTKAYYYKAVLWAVANEITNGTGENTFSPDNPCTRGQIVTFLYRALK